jgi:hypothetical protein
MKIMYIKKGIYNEKEIYLGSGFVSILRGKFYTNIYIWSKDTMGSASHIYYSIWGAVSYTYQNI